MKKNILFLLLITFQLFSLAQNDSLVYPKDYFGSPLDIPLYLSGNFGELRSNHFHAGIDIKTQGVEGKNVLASANGYVSRIKVQHGGYGKIIYIDHPNGFTTTYAHLQKFSKKIDAFVKKEQYHNQSYTINYYPDSNEIPVTKGEIIALSGNSGGSGGPHLHFEIRETKSEHATNVLLFNMPIKDNIAPIIRGVRIYPLDDQSTVNNTIKPIYVSASKVGNSYKLSAQPIVSNKIGFGIETIDKMNGTGNRCGVYNIQLHVDGELIYEQQTDKVPFNESRYINSHTDYQYKQSKHKWVHKSFIEPNNHLSIYKTLERDGVLTFTDDTIHSLKYIVKDVYGNTSTLNFKVKAKPQIQLMKKPVAKSFVKKMPYHIGNDFQAKDILVQIPKGGLYNDLNFNYSSAPHPKERWSNVHTVHTDKTPLHKPMELFIKCEFPKRVDPKKLIAVRKTDKGRTRIHTGEYANGYYHIKSKYFGSFYIYHDTLAPRIKPLNIYNGKNISKQSKFDFRVSDNLSGMKTYNCYIDGKWILLEYDYKKARLTHYKHDVISKGEHQLKLVITDAVGNEKTFECKFTN